jgi:hypothetical protein
VSQCLFFPSLSLVLSQNRLVKLKVDGDDVHRHTTDVYDQLDKLEMVRERRQQSKSLEKIMATAARTELASLAVKVKDWNAERAAALLAKTTAMWQEKAAVGAALRARIEEEEQAVRQHAQLVHALKVKQRHLRDEQVRLAAQRAAHRMAVGQRVADARRLVKFIDRDSQERELGEKLATLEQEERALLHRLNATHERHAQAFAALESLVSDIQTGSSGTIITQ